MEIKIHSEAEQKKTIEFVASSWSDWLWNPDSAGDMQSQSLDTLHSLSERDWIGSGNAVQSEKLGL